MESDSLRYSQFVLTGYSKMQDEDGEYLMAVKYILPVSDINFLRKLFAVDPNEPDPLVRDIVVPFDINQEQADALQPFLKPEEKLDLEKYDFQLESLQAPGTEEYWYSLKQAQDKDEK